MRDLQALETANRHAATNAKRPGYRRPTCPDIIAGAHNAPRADKRRNAYVISRAAYSNPDAMERDFRAACVADAGE
jgi:hypothetical protein